VASTSGGGSVTCGSSVTVSATPNENYSFVNWTEGGAAVSTSSNYTFTATNDGTLVANFLCSSSILPTNASFDASGGDGTVDRDGCAGLRLDGDQQCGLDYDLVGAHGLHRRDRQLHGGFQHRLPARASAR
jgi:hypothetical protein